MPTKKETAQNTRHWRAVRHLEEMVRITIPTETQMLDDFKETFDAVSQFDEVASILKEAATKIDAIRAKMDEGL